MMTYCGTDCCKECSRLSVSDLYLLTGSFVNLAYPLQNSAAQPVQFLTDSDVYLGNQIEIPGTDPDLVLYKRR